MAFAAAGGRQHDGLVDQGVLIDEVEKVFEQSRIRATVDRGCYHDDVSLLDRGQFPLYRVGQLRTPNRASELRGELTQFNQVLFTWDFAGDQVQQVLCQGGGFGGALQSAGNGY